ncbi:MAG: retinol dehydrogenase [Spirochaetae bacterium HGW-Spirochaetae-1]|jgi:NAD(P)-dependent dehydrogenase (short-subunit alcohol dehydrogenase family)|nr:MAG: retinol dehydrogenase [Spirochaetae bacterium HGW-Spirochaetae-1]
MARQTQRVLITGGNRGIGAAMAENLLWKGYRVTVICRDIEKAELFLREMKSMGLTGIDYIRGDLGSMESIRVTESLIREQSPLFSHFIHNAGIWPVRKVLNPDGLEQSFVTNHLAPFMLNHLLEDIFLKNKCRIIQISAGLYPLGMKNFKATATGDNFSILRTYASTKFLNLVTTMRFAEKWKGTGVVINAIHPGVVRTGLGEMRGLPGLVMKLAKHFCLSPAEGAEAPVNLAVNTRFEGTSGVYFDRFKPAELRPMALDREFINGVWNQAMSLCNFPA